MASYKDKKKLIEDSSDVYISDYDKGLDYSYLSDIIGQKRAYKTAEAAGDTAGMNAANAKANYIRMQGGSYTAGDDGKGYIRVKMPYEEELPRYTTSTTSYQKKRDDIYDRIANYGEFKYNVESDPLYQSYKKIYLALGNDAYDRAIAENALRTGGVASTSAISAAAAAQNKYNTMLSGKVPELYEIAYSKYKDGLSNLYKLLDSAGDIEASEYSKYRDSVSDYKADRTYYYNKDKDISDALYKSYLDDTQREADEEKAQYEKEKDARDFEYEKAVDEAKADNNRTKNALAYKKQEDEAELERYRIAVNLAKALYGKIPISGSSIGNIMSYLDK